MTQSNRKTMTVQQQMFLALNYQQYMRDRGDQLIGCYNLGRGSKKWWKRVFSYIIECSLLNAYILKHYAQPSMYSPSLQGRRRWDFLHFHLKVAEQFIGSFHFCQRSGHPSGPEHAPPSRLDKQLGHYPIQDTKKLECVVCNTKTSKATSSKK